jgi:sirohydrochlorin ferrochelatase
VESVAAALGECLNVACRVGYASASGPTAADAVEELRRLGATRILVASYFLAAGRLYDAAAGSATGAGAMAVAAPLGAAPELVEMVLDRVATVTSLD